MYNHHGKQLETCTVPLRCSPWLCESANFRMCAGISVDCLSPGALHLLVIQKRVRRTSKNITSKSIHWQQQCSSRSRSSSSNKHVTFVRNSSYKPLDLPSSPLLSLPPPTFLSRPPSSPLLPNPLSLSPLSPQSSPSSHPSSSLRYSSLRPSPSPIISPPLDPCNHLLHIRHVFV